MKLLKVQTSLNARQSMTALVLSFLLPLLLWSLVSYVPGLWHPKIRITDSGASFLLTEDQVVPREYYEQEVLRMQNEGASGEDIPDGVPSNPVYLPAPHKVVQAFYTAFTTEPKRRGEPWLHESLLHSVRIVFLAFLYSSLIGIPLGILAGAFQIFSRLIEPFVEFFRYLPAPAFGALAVAVLGINDGPKITIIVIGTLFQQILVIANTVRGLDRSLLEAAQTLGARTPQLIFKVIIPGVLPRMFKDLRILLGWAWTYLIVAEVVGASTGITWFINQQAKYRIYENVYAAIMMIGMIGLSCDMILAGLSKFLFPWEEGNKSGWANKFRSRMHWFFRGEQTFWGR